ncbi:serine/threonine and tyrosine kinase [Handroanthus impetiginosus]|uniref:Serine/threonine and tyrosine kinase n=1 Tax=Handroanthus impetiginosus TaxID=429701 RepID=A0A2G9H651_9LAMI|nr:serine/threonine and tyrosine kinase [Handroanthus impetiginosus]
MEGEPDLPAPPPEAKFFKPNLSRPININPESINLSRSFNTTSTCTSTTSSSSSSPPDLVRHVQAAFKRHRPLGMMQSNGIRPRRFLVPGQETSKESNTKPCQALDAKKSKEEIPKSRRLRGSVPQSKVMVSLRGETQEDASLTPPSECGTTVNTHEAKVKPYDTQGNQPGLSTRSGSNDAVVSSGGEPGNPPAEVQRKVHFSTENIATSRGADGRMATGTDDLLSHMDSLALTDMEWDVGNQVDTSAAVNQDWQQHNFQSMEMDNSLRSDGGISSLLARRTMGVQDQPNQFGNFLQNDLSNAMTQSSAVGSSCVTSTFINSTSAPMISSTTYSSQPQIGGVHLGTEPTGEAEVQLDAVQPSYSLSKYAGGVVSQQLAVTSQAISSIAEMPVEVNRSSGPSKELQSSLPQDYNILRNSSPEDNNSAKGNVTDVKSQPPSSTLPPSDVKLENSKSEKLERGVSGKASSTSRKKGYDPDLFFKVNGKLYQRLGKIGSGGSSEVHKVISSDCTIYALKKIKLKGRDYATAYGFCQEIEYLNRLRGKNNIIQLIDYEVTDNTLLQEVMNGSISNRDARVKDDGYIYMVLEYGEIDLAHMLSQKWKELDGTNATIDENWLRFYWQQILQAVNTIHEERIVHSDLKPANFLLVRGSLKLIDFGIAKAIMSDTTNIQRDSQVGTLSYMSPEAFMCNETDANGNTIKCGRPSDIWSLGCILYQMVYGRTPFSEYKTFWAKFKVITDPNHEIIYEPVSNPWLLDLMKKCLAWDRNERWRIPQLLQHPFLVPPVPPKSPDQSCKLLKLIAESSADDQKISMLCSQLQAMFMEPTSVVQSESSTSREQLRKLLCKISTVCFQLQEQLASL